jgi:hypothetical protein
VVHLNESVVHCFYFRAPMHYGLPETRASVVGDRVVTQAGEGMTYRFLLVPSSLRTAGDVVGRDRRAGLTLFRVES